MTSDKLVSEFGTAYSNARILIKKGAALDARKYIIRCMQILLELYKQTSKVMGRVKLYSRICEFKHYSSVLYESGVTEEIKLAFNLTKDEEPTKTIAPEEKSNDPIDEIISDGYSQGWCADICEKNLKSVVRISANTRSSGSNGTGFIISEKGFILTNDHIVFDEDNCEYYKKIVMSFAGENTEYKLQIVDSDKKNDVALCRFEPSELPEVRPVHRIKNYGLLKPGADILVIGNTFSMGLTPFSGTVRMPHDNDGNLLYTAPSNPGDSGGPVFNRAGECVGINKSITVRITRGDRVMDSQGMTNATPMDKIDELLDKWVKSYNLEL